MDKYQHSVRNRHIESYIQKLAYYFFSFFNMLIMFWFFLRVDVAAEANPWYRVVRADLFVLSLVLTTTFGLIWSYLQSAAISGWDTLFLVLFILSNLVLFGGVYWSKFAHMFYKPGAAIQKHLAEADGSRQNLPAPADKPKQFGFGIKREEPRHY